MKLHLGCGKNYLKGYLNCDISHAVRTDKIIDLEETLPFEDSSIKKIVITHTLEHIEKFNELVFEMHRASKDRAIIKIKVPFHTHFGAFMDPTHKRFFTPFTFVLFRKSFINTIINPLINLDHKIYCRFFAQIFPAAEIYFELITIK